MRKGSLSLQLALWVGVLALLQAAAVLAFAYFTLAGELDSQQRAVLRDKTEHARQLVASAVDGGELGASTARFSELTSGHSELHLIVSLSGSNQPWLALSSVSRESLLRLRRDTWGPDAVLEWRSEVEGRLMLSIATTARTQNGDSYDVVVSTDRSKDERLLAGLLFTSLTAAPFALALVSISALAIVKLGLRPLSRFSRAAAHISAHSLSTRIDKRGLPEELQRLADAFNAMLDRLDEGVRRLSEFSSDLAHELRTPLATLLGRTQVTLSQQRNTAELVDVLVGNVDELQRLSRLVADMLFLAQADDARATLNKVNVDLAEEARQLVDFIQMLADERDMSVVVSGRATVHADRQLVRRVVTNLLSNALRHGTRGSTVTVHARVDANNAYLEVSNKGEPIPVEHQARLFDRFYRIDGSRARDSGGSGLGLAIVRAIMALHGGSVQVRSDAGFGTSFTLYFPEMGDGASPSGAPLTDHPPNDDGETNRSLRATEPSATSPLTS